MNVRLEKKLAALPRSPGVYFYKSKSGEIIYVGKAAMLRNRVRQYFQSSRGLDTKTMALVAEIDDVDWMETDSEIDALFLESEMVKRYMPRYNVLLRDDKSQTFVRISMKDEWPTVSFTRNPADDGAEYFGPFYSGYAVKKALRYLRRVFPYFIREPNLRDSKLEMQIGLKPDMNDGSAAYKENLRKLVSYIKGNRKKLVREIEFDMRRAAEVQDFETAAKLRNRLRNFHELQRRIMFGDKEFLHISKDKALDDLTTLLGLGDVPRRIECYDISHQGGKNVVASMVVFSNGVSDRASYRKFKMTRQVNDDTGQIYDTVYRRLSKRNLRGWSRPDLLIIDGGKGQLNAAIRAQKDRNTNFPIVSVAKREEELIIHRDDSNVSIKFIENMINNHTPGVDFREDSDFITINLHAGQRNLGSHTKNLRGEDTQSPYTELVKLLQRIRDESHRFAVSYHSVLKRKNATKSCLEDIPGVGPKTRQKIIKTFGSVSRLAEVPENELAELIGSNKAKAIKDFIG
ncbi:UvrB/UvrC motif-containing protein [Candidatus Nomurabacteria bacterium]|nr:UvrB/UvrC motif-containing protein [Candidatus Nomurabacteria bacterium]